MRLFWLFGFARMGHGSVTVLVLATMLALWVSLPVPVLADADGELGREHAEQTQALARDARRLQAPSRGEEAAQARARLERLLERQRRHRRQLRAQRLERPRAELRGPSREPVRASPEARRTLEAQVLRQRLERRRWRARQRWNAPVE